MGTKGSTSSKNWSPNNVKAVVITRACILVAFHTKQPTFVPLDVATSMQDISKNGSTGSLHNLLAQRQLSCLEEIYVDSIFQNYTGIMNLDEYVRGLVSTVSRLRFYGYIGDGQLTNLPERYGNAKLNGLTDYTYALDKERKLPLQYQSTDNGLWYTKYNLRPDKYPIDSKRGALHAWFKMVESDLTKRKQEELSRIENEGIGAAINALFSQDVVYADDLRYLLLLRKHILRQSDQVSQIVKEEYSKLSKGVLKINLELLMDNLELKSARETVIIGAYKNYGVITQENVDINLEKLIEYARTFSGFLRLPDTLCNILSSVTDKSSIAYMIVFATLIDSGEISPSNKLPLVFKDKRTEPNCVGWYTDLLLKVCGVSKEMLDKKGEE